MPAVSLAQVDENIKTEKKPEEIKVGATWFGLVPCGREVWKLGEKGSIDDAVYQDKIIPSNEGENTLGKTEVSPRVDKTGTPKNPCNFNYLMTLVNNVIHFILFYMVVPIVVIMFVYAGVLLVTSGGEPGARTKAKGIFFNAVIGLVIALAAFIIVKTILITLGYTNIKDFFK